MKNIIPSALPHFYGLANERILKERLIMLCVIEEATTTKTKDAEVQAPAASRRRFFEQTNTLPYWREALTTTGYRTVAGGTGTARRFDHLWYIDREGLPVDVYPVVAIVCIFT
jgi:hypothetical protein